MIAPTLLVGLGGTGAKIVRYVSDLANEDQRKTLGFVVFDTDINELRDIQKSSPFIKTVQTSTKLSVGEYLNIDNHARDTWFPVNAILNSKTLTEGAGQVRAISRLALDTAIRAGKLGALHEAIQELYKLDENAPEQALRIIIVSSLAGGTGSGLILPVALYLKNYMATRFRQNANITRGFFILPEVFDEVIPGQAERNNLRSNAYATLRELDAFLMKGDDTLPERYRSTVRMEFPRVGSAGTEEYVVRPYDFCFLFDAQNAEGKKLNSFNQYLEHAANCIFAQSIGPMNKRSNSSEDNTIRALCAERGRNRYAGAGSSMLIYPTEDVKEFVALNWTKECVSAQWLMFDQMHREMSRINAEKRSKGIAVVDTSAAVNYVTQVEQMAKQNHPFARSIVNACTIFDGDGITKISESWTEYLAELMNKIAIDQSSGQASLDGQRDQVLTSIGDLEGGAGSWEGFVDAYKALEKYKGLIIKHSEDTAHSVAYTVFKAGAEAVTKDRQRFRLESYLRDSEGQFIHPNAVRYFLYKVYDLLVAHNKSVIVKNKDATDFFEGFTRQFDDPDTETLESVESLADRKISLIDRIRKRLSHDQQALKDAYNSFLVQADEYRVNSVLELVLKEGIEYVRALSEAFEVLYTSLEGKVPGIERRINHIITRYKHTKGRTARYVSASEKCLTEKARALPYTGSMIAVDSDLADEIYSRVHKYASLSVKPKDDSFFSELFETGILGYFKSSLMKTRSQEVDLDIISALEEEYKYEHESFDENKIQQYVTDTIHATRALSCPFIEKPLGEERQPILACAYHSTLNPKDNSPRTALVEKELRNAGGVEDDDIAKNMVLFYQSFYGLRANDLSKFAPAQKSATSSRDGGEYFKAYFELIADIHPEPHKSKAITPHIDRWWHVVTHMPDLDDQNQLTQEYNVFAALFWCLAGSYIDMFDIGTENQRYMLKVDELKMSEELDTLIVSNGTPCDHLYEVLDALSIFPDLVTNILERVEYLTTQDIYDGTQDCLEDGMLAGFLRAFRVKEFPLGADNQVRSIFDIPLLMRRSVTTDAYYEDYLLRLLKVEVSEINKYLARFYNSKELPEVTGGVILEQFEKFLAGIALEQRYYKDIYRDYLFSKICSVIQLSLEEYGLRRHAAAAKKLVEALQG